MDLSSGRPFWPIKNGLIASYPTLKRDEACDVAIIGGGITFRRAASRGMEVTRNPCEVARQLLIRDDRGDPVDRALAGIPDGLCMVPPEPINERMKPQIGNIS